MAASLDAREESLRDEPSQVQWHGGADFGLLVLRLVLGGTFLAHGAQIMFRAFGGPGADGFATFLAQHGYHSTRVLALVTGCTELGGGALLVFGLFTPVAAAAILGVMANAILVKVHNGFFATPGNGFELEVALAVMAFCVLFAGPGRAALDNGRPWYRHPVASGWTLLIIAVAAAGGVFYVFHGVRSLHGL